MKRGMSRALNEQEEFSRRMAIQQRLITRYRWRCFLLTGRLPKRNEAAAEWIALHAAEFARRFIA